LARTAALAVPSASTRHSLGPASISMPQWPDTMDLAAVTCTTGRAVEMHEKAGKGPGWVGWGVCVCVWVGGWVGGGGWKLGTGRKSRTDGNPQARLGSSIGECGMMDARKRAVVAANRRGRRRARRPQQRTHLFPGPTMTSAQGTGPMPYAMAAMACAHGRHARDRHMQPRNSHLPPLHARKHTRGHDCASIARVHAHTWGAQPSRHTPPRHTRAAPAPHRCTVARRRQLRTRHRW
jgi:hypothetical protein